MLPRAEKPLALLLGASLWCILGGMAAFIPVDYPYLPGGPSQPSASAPTLLRLTPVPNVGCNALWKCKANQRAALAAAYGWRLMVAPLPLSQAKAWAPSYVTWILGLKDSSGEPAYENVVVEYIGLGPNGAPGTMFQPWPHTDARAWWEQQPGITPRFSLKGTPMSWVKRVPYPSELTLVVA